MGRLSQTESKRPSPPRAMKGGAGAVAVPGLAVVAPRQLRVEHVGHGVHAQQTGQPDALVAERGQRVELQLKRVFGVGRDHLLAVRPVDQVLALGVDHRPLARKRRQRVLGQERHAALPQAGALHARFEGAAPVDPVLAVHLAGHRDEAVIPLRQHVADRLEVDTVLGAGGEDAPVLGVDVHRVPVQELVGPLVAGFVDHRAVVDEAGGKLRFDDDVVVLVAAVLADAERRALPVDAVAALRVAHPRLGRVARAHVPHPEPAVDAQHRAVQTGAVALPGVRAGHYRLRILGRLVPDALRADRIVDQSVVEKELAVGQIADMGVWGHVIPLQSVLLGGSVQSGMSNIRCRLPPWIRRRSSRVM